MALWNGLPYDHGRRLVLVANVGDPAIPGSHTLSVVSLSDRAMRAEITVPGRTRWAVYDPDAQAFYVNIAEPAQIALRNLSDDDRRRVGAWIDNLKNWGCDPFVAQHSKQLDADQNVYMLLTSSDIRIFFSLEEDVITVLEVAKKATIINSGQISGAGSR